MMPLVAIYDVNLTSAVGPNIAHNLMFLCHRFQRRHSSHRHRRHHHRRCPCPYRRITILLCLRVTSTLFSARLSTRPDTYSRRKNIDQEGKFYLFSLVIAWTWFLAASYRGIVGVFFSSCFFSFLCDSTLACAVQAVSKDIVNVVEKKIWSKWRGKKRKKMCGRQHNKKTAR